MDTVKAFTVAIAAAQASVLTLHDSGQRDPIAMATLVAPGIAVAKASDLEGKAALDARDHRRRTHAVTVVSTDKATDLAILKVDWPDGKPVAWADAPPLLGTWVIASTPRIGMVRVGLNAALPRPIENRGASLGVVLQDPPKNKKGALIAEVFPDSAADKARLKKDDLVVMAGDKTIAKRADLGDFLKIQEPGAKVAFKVMRKGMKVHIDVILDSPSDMLDKMNRNQQMSGPTSRRKDPFPMILQTDIPVPPESMGGPLLDLDGRAVGILIARADRVTTFAIPKEHVLPLLANPPLQ